MNEQNEAHPRAEAPTGAPPRTGLIRRFYDAWRRWEKRMDHGPYDYTLDRIGQLEDRVTQLERARNALGHPPGAPDAMAQIGMARNADNGGVT